jgi:hypothetical protein
MSRVVHTHRVTRLPMMMGSTGKVLDHVRDIPHHGEEEEDDNLLARPRYKPTPTSPVFK